MTQTVSEDTQVEDVESFRRRARAWLAENMLRLPPEPQHSVRRVEYFADADDRQARHRVLQRQLFDGGFAGITFPREYGGLGLSAAHQRAFTEESVVYEMPGLFNIPTFSICGATLLEFGTEEQKRRHILGMLRGDALWIQFLSEPTGGSDLAGLLTSAVRDGDEWVLNGSKIWSTGAFHADWALCLARTNWDVPKHRGLTMFIMEVHQPGVEIHRIKMVNGSMEFCQEFFTDLRIPHSDVLGEVDDGWQVATRLLFHERNAVGGGSTFVSGRDNVQGAGPDDYLLRLVDVSGRLDDPVARDLLGEAHTLKVVEAQIVDRISRAMRTGVMNENAASILRLYRGVMSTRLSTISLDIAGRGAAAWTDDDAAIGDVGMRFVSRQTSCIGGGTTEMARNSISERVLGMPREQTGDRDIPFKQVRRNA